MNVHTPERQAGESQTEYRRRQAESKRQARAMTSASNGGQTSRQIHRAERRKSGKLKGQYGRGLMNQFDRQRERDCVKKHPLRDETGAFTLVGAKDFIEGQRRVWLAGVSQQRGF